MKETYLKWQWRGRHAWGEVQTHKGSGPLELYAPAIEPGGWILITVVGVYDDDSEVELEKIIVKR